MVQALVDAIYKRKLETVEHLIRQGVDVNAPHDRGDTALRVAAYMGDVKILKALVQAEADVNCGNDDGTTAIAEAARYGHIKAVQFLLKAGAEPGKAWRRAAEEGHTEIVKLLIGDAQGINERYNIPGDTALMKAAFSGHVDTVRYLLSRGADVNIRSGWGETALVHASDGGSTEVVRLLLAHGAEIEAAGNHGKSALMHAAQWDHAKVVALLLAKGAKIGNAAYWCAGNENILRMVAEKGGDINARGHGGRTPLMRAAGMGRTDAVRFLLERGADIHARDERQRTCLMFPAWWEENKYGDEDDGWYLDILPSAPESARAMLDYRADVNARDADGWTALMYAGAQGLGGLVALLLERGGDPAAVNDDVQTALQIAIATGQTDAVRLLENK